MSLSESIFISPIIFSQNPYTLFIVDKDGKILLTNPYLAILIGVVEKISAVNKFTSLNEFDSLKFFFNESVKNKVPTNFYGILLESQMTIPLNGKIESVQMHSKEFWRISILPPHNLISYPCRFRLLNSLRKQIRSSDSFEECLHYILIFCQLNFSCHNLFLYADSSLEEQTDTPVSVESENPFLPIQNLSENGHYFLSGLGDLNLVKKRFPNNKLLLDKFNYSQTHQPFHDTLYNTMYLNYSCFQIQSVNQQKNLGFISMFRSLPLTNYESLLFDSIAQEFSQIFQTHSIRTAYEETKQFYKDIFHSVNESIAIIDPETHKFIEINHSFMKEFEVTSKQRDEIVLESLVSPEFKSLISDVLSTLSESKSFSAEWIFQKNKENTFWGEVNFKTILLSNQKKILMVIRNVQERISSEIIIQENKSLLDNFMKTSTEGFILLDNNFQIHMINTSAQEMLRLETEENLINKNLSNVLSKSFSLEVIPILKEVIRTGNPNSCNFKLRNSYSEIVYLYLNAFQASNGLGLILNDITELLRKQEEIKLERDILKLFINNAPYIIMGVQSDGLISFSNPAAENIVSSSKNCLVGKNWQEIFLNSNIPDEISFSTLIEDEKRDFELSFVCNDTVRIMSWNTVFWFNSENHNHEIIFFGNDITDQRNAENEIKALAKFPDENPNPIMRISNKYKILYANEASFPLLKLWKCGINEKLPPGFHPFIDRVFKDDKDRVIDIHTSSTTYLLHFNPVPEQNYINLYGDDVTAQRRAEWESRISRDNAEKANLAKSEFLANMSHEIRTPLNAILGMAELLKSNSKTKEQHKYSDILINSGESLLNLVNDILDISKIESGEVEIEEIEVDIIDLIEKVSEIFSLKASQKKLNLFHILPPEIPRFILSDPTRIRQMLFNLLSNSIKFTEKGFVSLEVKVHEENENSYLLFSIEDSGIGIPEEHQNKIFHKFLQADNSITRKYGGTGLGLSICRKISELWKGKLWLESIEKKGTTFHFTLPLKINQENNEVLKDSCFPDQYKNHKILLGISSAKTLKILKNYLSPTGIDISVASSPAEIIQLLSLNSFDLTILSREEGQENISEILDSNLILPVNENFLILSSIENSDPGIIEKFNNKNIHLLKTPLILRDFFSRTQAFFKYKSDDFLQPVIYSISPQAKETRKNLAGKILVVEDTKDNQFLIQAFLKKTDFELIFADNGKMAVDIFQKQNFDLILMDMQMPIMDGYTATKKIREIERISKSKPVPIAALTAHVMREEIDKCFQFGCNAYLSKPIRKLNLIEAIENLLQ